MLERSGQLLAATEGWLVTESLREEADADADADRLSVSVCLIEHALLKMNE